MAAYVIPISKVNNPCELPELELISIPCGPIKLKEKIITDQLNDHLTINGILPSVKTGSRSGYSCTSVLLYTTDNIFHNIDRLKRTILVRFDFSKASDT